MKKLFFLLSLTATIANCQTFSIDKVSDFKNGEPGPMKGLPEDIFMSTITFSNSGPNTIYLFLDRVKKSIPPYWTLCYCYKQCHSPADDTVTVTVLPFDTTNISLQFKTDSVNPGISTATFHVFQKGYPTNIRKIEMVASTLPDNVGLSEESRKLKVLLFPNPANDRLTISDDMNELRIYNAQAQLISEYDRNTKTPDVDVSEFAPGYYFVQGKKDGATVTGTFIKN